MSSKAGLIEQLLPLPSLVLVSLSLLRSLKPKVFKVTRSGWYVLCSPLLLVNHKVRCQHVFFCFWFQTEVNYLGQLSHPNLVKLVGYCVEGEDRLLVYEFMPKGSLENHLFRRM